MHSPFKTGEGCFRSREILPVLTPLCVRFQDLDRGSFPGRPCPRGSADAGPDVSTLNGDRFYLILANYNFYFVQDPEAALLDRRNALARLWQARLFYSGLELFVTSYTNPLSVIGEIPTWEIFGLSGWPSLRRSYGSPTAWLRPILDGFVWVPQFSLEHEAYGGLQKASFFEGLRAARPRCARRLQGRRGRSNRWCSNTGDRRCTTAPDRFF